MIESKFIDLNQTKWTKWQLAFGSITMAIEATLPDFQSLASAMPWRATLLLGGNHPKMTKFAILICSVDTPRLVAWWAFNSLALQELQSFWSAMDARTGVMKRCAFWWLHRSNAKPVWLYRTTTAKRSFAVSLCWRFGLNILNFPTWSPFFDYVRPLANVYQHPCIVMDTSTALTAPTRSVDTSSQNSKADRVEVCRWDCFCKWNVFLFGL